MKTSDFFYELPNELIAQSPIEERDKSRLMIVDRKTGKIEHKIFSDIVEYLGPNDCLVINNTKVIPCRVYCHKENCSGNIEVLLLHRKDLFIYEAIAKPMKRIHIGEKLIFSDNMFAVCKHKDDSILLLQFNVKEGTLEAELDKIGNVPLPPYITKKLEDRTRYQTVYAKISGSAAAPTAGFHFTKDLFEKIKRKGVQIIEVNLEIGLGTFRPVKTENIEDHKMHSEYCVVSENSAKLLNEAKRNGKRIIAVGTTSVRTLETAQKHGEIIAGHYNTNIFLYPGKKFNFVDSIITNFHLPESTLIMLVSAFLGTEKTIECYNLAVKEKYRFFSFGDAMWIK